MILATIATFLIWTFLVIAGFVGLFILVCIPHNWLMAGYVASMGLIDCP